MPKTVAILGTLDTKGEEFAYLRSHIERAGLSTLVVDCGVLDAPAFSPDISRQDVASAGGEELGHLLATRDRGRSIAAMAAGAAAVVRRLFEERRIQGLISLGGSAGTTIGTAAMRSLPAGFPKLMVSTLASGDTRPYVGTKDIAMLYPIVDIAGLNRLSRRILANAAAAIAGMVDQEETEGGQDKPLIAATMFGVTTPCVTMARHILEQQGFEVLVFHATGTGGEAMESLIADGYVAGVLDITTTELADELAGGVMSAGPHRLEAAGAKGVPQVVCPGAIDMVNFGPLDSVPEKYRERRLYVHNPNVTLMRTTPEECAELGRITAEKLNRARGPVAFLMPLRGVSAIDAAGLPFWWPEADASYLGALEANLDPEVRLLEVGAHINDEGFARSAADSLLQLMSARAVSMA
ncbi:MAG TPA: Tm-1-like ATP-binding domain-containing protein [Terriglobia bacterium]|nr:Tm-1-like ATP-binding domain-containing protein [Terriglobia bacterium]